MYIVICFVKLFGIFNARLRTLHSAGKKKTIKQRPVNFTQIKQFGAAQRLAGSLCLWWEQEEVLKGRSAPNTFY